MIYTIISGTNRKESYTEKVAGIYQKIFKEQGIDAPILSLIGLNVQDRDPAFIQMEEHFLVPAQKFVFIAPEYNGSYPGVLKTLIDNSDIKASWWWKKALLTGVSAGRAGNLRGMDHLNGTLQYMKMIVHPNKLPISIVDTLFDEAGNISHSPTYQSISDQIQEFIEF